MKIKSFGAINDPEDIKLAIFRDNRVPILVAISSVELYFDDISSLKGKSDSDSLSTFGIVGFEESEDG